MNEKTHPSKLPVADEVLTKQLLDSASEFVTGDTPIALHTGKIMSGKLPLIAAIQVTEYVLYMAAFAVAEKEANKLGFTLRKWTDEEISRTREAHEAGMAARDAGRRGPTNDDVAGVIDELQKLRDKKNLH